jgi:hypothetical protein
MPSRKVNLAGESIVDEEPGAAMQDMVAMMKLMQQQLLIAQQPQPQPQPQPQAIQPTKVVVQKVQTENCCQTCVKCFNERHAYCCPRYSPSAIFYRYRPVRLQIVEMMTVTKTVINLVVIHVVAIR